MIRRLVVHVMYVTAETIQLAADRISPPGDEVWRDRAWKRYLTGKARKDEYASPDALRGISPEYRQARDAVLARFTSCKFNVHRVRADDE
jgi:hypothetical protein